MPNLIMKVTCNSFPFLFLGFDKTIDMVDTACEEVRSIAHQMMPYQLNDKGLIPALELLFQNIFERAGIKYHFDSPKKPGDLSEDLTIGIYRVAQELASNVIKHAGAETVNVQLYRTKTDVVFIMEDNGVGMPESKNGCNGMGLYNIESRVKTLNGHFSLTSLRGNGILAQIRIPYEKQ